MSERSLFNRIKSDQIADRIDPEYYTKDLLANEALLERFHESRLCDLVDKLKPNNIADLTSNGSFEFLRGIEFNEVDGIPFIRTQNLMDGYVDDSEVIYVNQKCRSMVAKSLCETGDLIVCRKGKVGAASALPEKLNGAAISENVTRFSLRAEDDADFIAAFLNSNQGRKRFLREATGVIQKWINNEKLREIRVIRLDARAEKYIGDKVRQAERLRAWARALEVKFELSLKKLAPEAFENRGTGRKYSRASVADISYTLNPGAFDEERLRVQHYLLGLGGKRFSKLAEISGATTRAYKPDTTYVGLDAISSNTCQLAPSSVEEAEISGTCRLLGEGPVIAKLRPYLNKVSYIPKRFAGSVGSTELLCITPRGQYSGWYLYGVLKSELALKQLRPLATGATHPRIDQYDVRDLVVLVSEDQEILGQLLETAQSAYFLASELTAAAKFLVEALIEGRLTEAELISAEQALQAGNDQLDRCILNRLKTNGVDGQGPALFADLDELYNLLKQAEGD